MQNKIANYGILLEQLEALLDGESDQIANMANASALLFQSLDDINWAGFYLYKNDELILGPFQGKVACVHIPLGKGVCGVSAQSKEILCIANVHEFPTHIACDSASNSEIVIPLIKKDTLIGVLDIDSASFSRFDDTDKLYLSLFAQLFIQSL